MIQRKIILRFIRFFFVVFIFCYFGGIYTILRNNEFEIPVEYEIDVLPVVENEMNCSTCSNRTVNASIWSSAMSTCDGYATTRGDHQMVVCFSLFGGVSNAYFRGISRNAELMPQFYPNWVMRVYHNLDLNDAYTLKSLCELRCKYPHLDFCRMSNLPPPLMNQSHVHSKVWRFFALGDPLVSHFVSRDLDSLISEREVAAVGQWLISGKTWHFMRDHPQHGFPIMGGMWGGMNRNVTLNKQLRERLIEEAQKEPNDNNDQPSLRAVILPIAEENEDYINHDSFSCHESVPKKSWPWPVKRLHSSDFVGNPILRYDYPISGHCPMRCRPPNHQDWELC